MISLSSSIDTIQAFTLHEEKLMNSQTFQRKLAAVLSADVHGYSRLMGDDEIDTVRTITTYRNVMTTCIGQHSGRVVDSPGDNLLAEFGSVVDAVKCAVEIQKELKTHNAALPEERRMEFRIGINLGDVIVDGERIYGEGVNIAARIGSLADAGGICVSRNVFDQVSNKLNMGFEYLGEHTVKNIAEPVRVYRAHLDPLTVVPDKSKDLKVPERPSIVVLPFVNISGDPEQEYFSDGITEDLITDLSKISGLFVIARNSAFTYKGKNVKVDEVGRELGVRYLLEGSVRKAKDRIRITAQLVDATTGGHIWAERYDRELEDIFALQDEVTQEIVSVLAVKLTEDEQYQRLCKCNFACNMDAYDYYLRGLEYMLRFKKDTNAEARALFEKAIEMEPKYTLAYTMLGQTYLNDWKFGWLADYQSIERAYELANKAIELHDVLSEAHGLLGEVYLWKHQHGEAIAELERAVSLDPNDAEVLMGLGNVLTWAGRPEEAIGYITKAMRNNPIYPAYYLWNMGHAYYLMEEYEEAIAAFERAINIDPNFWPSHVYSALSYGVLGREEEARSAVAEVLKLDPDFSLETLCRRAPYKKKAHSELFFSVLRNLGLGNESDCSQ